jgi:acyl-coenzyme A thioesterase PaaI-like protein
MRKSTAVPLLRLAAAAAATLVDVVGSAALVTLSDRGGVSLAINTLYLNPMPGAALSMTATPSLADPWLAPALELRAPPAHLDACSLP